METSIIDDLMITYDNNLGRVRNLLKIYDTLKKRGRSKVINSDLLRVAVVLLHATLEDFLRTVMKELLPEKGKLDKIPLYSEDYKNLPKFTLADLSKYRDLSVEDVITNSVHHYLNKQSYNNATEIMAAIRSVNISTNKKMQQYCSKIEVMVQRRHHIVHQADKQDKTGQGNFKVKSISYKNVSNWIDDVDKFITEIINEL